MLSSGWNYSRVCVLCPVFSCLAQTDPNSQIDLTLGGTVPRPVDGMSAANTIPQRQQVAIAYLACGREIQFLAWTRGWGRTHSDTSGGGAVKLLLGKKYRSEESRGGEERR